MSSLELVNVLPHNPEQNPLRLLYESGAPLSCSGPGPESDIYLFTWASSWF